MKSMKSKKISISTVCLLPILIFFIFMISFTVLFTLNFLKDENEQAKRLSKRIGKGVSGELLIPDRTGLEITLRRAKIQHELDILTIEDSPKECPWYYVGCANTKIPFSNGKYIYLKKGSHAFEELVIGIGSLIIVSLISILAVFIVLKVYISDPLEYLAGQYLSHVKNYLDSNQDDCDGLIHSPVTQISYLSSSIRTLAINLKDSINRQKKIKLEAEKNAALASQASAIAHDVRSPFTIFKNGISILDEAESLNEVKDEIMPMIKKDVNKSLKKVERLLADILDYSGTMTIEKELLSIKSALYESLLEVSGEFDRAKIKIHYDFSSEHLVECDSIKISQVFINILTNAIQAMKGIGEIWIYTNSIQGNCNIQIKNNNSYIDNNDLDKVFEVQYSKGKKSGKGFGLAISKKIVDIHSGKIFASSNFDEKTVTFSVFLPETEITDNISSKFPDRLEGYSLIRKHSFPARNIKREQMLERLRSKVSKMNRKLSVAVLDDEISYIESLSRMISKDSLEELIDLHVFSSAENFLNFELQKLEFIITDIDLQADVDGYDVIDLLRKQKGIKVPICVHSNRMVQEDMKKAFDSGANSIVLKPMTSDHLLNFLTAVEFEY